VPHTTNKDLDLFEIYWSCINNGSQQFVVKVYSVNILFTLKSLVHSDMHPFFEGKFWCPDDIVTITTDSKRDCKFTIKWENGWDS